MQDMKTTLTKMFIVLVLMMIGMGAKADVKVYFGEKGTEKFEGSGGTVEVKQEESKDDNTQVTVYLGFIPQSGYSFDEKSLEIYAVIPTDANSTRTPDISDSPLKLEEDKSENPGEKHYHVTIDSKLGLWVKSATFTNKSEGAKSGTPVGTDYSGVYYIASDYQTPNSTNRNYNTTTLTNNYYLCPTENWISYSPTSPNWTTGDALPFLTTYKINAHNDYDKIKALWTIEFCATVSGTDYYYFKHSSGRYMVLNNSISAVSGSNATMRLRVHLETLTSEQLEVEDTRNLALFSITQDDRSIVIRPKTLPAYQFTVNGGNGDYTRGDGTGKGKITSGSTTYGMNGTIAIYNQDKDDNKYFYLEEAVMPPTITVNADGTVAISSAEGTRFYYTTNGDTPTTSGEGESSPITINTTDEMTAIKAIAVRTSDNKKSEVVSRQFQDYIYKIVDFQGHIAIKYKVTHQLEGSPLTGYESIPAAIRSPYLANEDVTFYDTFSAEGSRDNLYGVITSIPSTTEIFVSYTNKKLSDKPLHLSGQRELQMKINGKYVYDDEGSLKLTDSDADITQNYLWKFSGQDPYRVQIQNTGSAGRFLNWSTSPSPSLSLGTSNGTYFIILGGSVMPDGFTDQIELITATGDLIDAATTCYNVGGDSEGNAVLLTNANEHDAAVQVLLKATEHKVGLHIIDKSQHIVIEGDVSLDDLAVPKQWRSPLVREYHFYKGDDFDVTTDGEGRKVYTLKSTATPIGNYADAPSDHIYVTYDVKTAEDDGYIDLDGGNNRDNDGKIYLLKFAHGGVYQLENSSDNLMVDELENPILKKAVYPYANGEANLYVYDGDRWADQQGSAANTRTRWAWYLESPNRDPYHVKVASFQSYDLQEPNQDKQNNRHLYLRTYKPDGYSEVVTGAISDHTAASDANAIPTEYMILGTEGAYKLMTTEPVDDLDGNPSNDIRQTVTSFESYWKNNPTVVKHVLGIENPEDEFAYTDDHRTILRNKGWHDYYAWGNTGTPSQWTSTSNKRYKYEYHWFLKVDMGVGCEEDEKGEFDFEPVEIVGALILLDNHGWEIMRKPTARKAQTSVKPQRDAAIKVYDSPMVVEYHFFYNFHKEYGYHKYRPENKNIYAEDKEVYTYLGSSTSLADYGNFELDDNSNKLVNNGTLRDIYVTYTAQQGFYEGTTVENGLPVLGNSLGVIIQQGLKYAKIQNGELSPTDMSVGYLDQYVTGAEIPSKDMLWHLQPNINIDQEMGLIYSGEEGAQTYAPTKAKQEQDYVDGDGTGRGKKNGFDPYNVQIVSTEDNTKFFVTDATGGVDDPNSPGDKTTLYQSNGITRIATGTSTLSLGSGSSEKYKALDHDGRTAHVTNATFMLVKDVNGNMRLMPRFDHSKVAASLATMTNLASQDAAAAPVSDDGTGSALTTLLFTTPQTVSKSSEITVMSGYYTLANNFEADVAIGTEESPFTGSINGRLQIINTLDNPLEHPFVAYAEGATIKNVILGGVHITEGTNVGAICNEAKGDTRIYNCGVNGGSVGGSGSVGGIVGLLDGSSRVINCYSYAEITGGEDVGGIVGYNTVGSTANNIKTMVMNCMFYGDITGGSTVSPVYGGNNINNLNSGGLNTFNYYAYDVLTKAISAGKYNCALGVEDVFLTRFETYRQLLNSNRRLAAYYATSSKETVHAEDMMKWVLETADRSIAKPKPYPVLKAQGKYPSIINYDTRDLANYSETNRNKGLKTGTLEVTFSNSKTTGGQDWPTDASISGTITLTRTDKDFDHYNYNYDKVQLPYYNDYGTKNYTGGKVVTGWKITSMTGGTTGTYSPSDDFGGYNFADRKCTNKDLYGQSGRVFSQGAYFDVPYGVTGITIEPYWGNAAYVADEYLDVVYNTTYGEQKVTQLGKWFDTQKIKIDGSEYTVYKTIDDAAASLTSGSNVYDNAIVLVGNVHLAGNPPTASKFTIMSADFDKDNEPDYSFIFGHNDRQAISPVRFDFINMPGIAMVQKPNGAGTFRNVSIFKPKGWFETTNTCITRFVQFEYDNGNKSAAPVIIQGGMVDQFVSTKTSEPKVTQYIHLGGNVWFKDFGNGTHSDGNKFTPHIPISVTGGEYTGFYLSGTYRPDAAVNADNAECYISGGYFGEVAGAAQQQINGNVQWQIYDADIDNFYGGGINAGKPVTGNITTKIINSHVGTFCGGPKFGNMSSEKTVTTNATGCTFDKFFGAGFGGISYNRVRTRDVQNATSSNFSSWKSDYTGKRGKYIAENSGVATDFDYEFFVWSTGVVGARFYVKYASLSTAQTNDVTSTLTRCIINKDFYGGGSLGNVLGTATSVLEDCTVEGNVFGGGYSASKPKVPIRTADVFDDLPDIDKNAGVFDMGKPSATEDFTLIAGTLSNNNSAINEAGSPKTIVTDVDMTTLGHVTNTDLTISGNTIVRGKIFDEAGEVIETTGGVFGGGDMSAVNGNTKVDVQNTESTEGILNIFGGGNTADVVGSTQVDMTGGKVSQDVYGGGKGATTVVGGDVTVNIGAKSGDGSLSGAGIVDRNVYGGSALGTVNAVAVNIYGGTVNGNVYGGGLGQLASGNPEESNYLPSIAALNLDDAVVTIEGGTVKETVYGGSNANGVLKKDVRVTTIGGTVGTLATSGDSNNVVFGGGYGEPTLVEGSVEVNIGTSGQESAGAVINGSVYGGGALGSVNASKPESSLVFDATKEVDVNLYAGTINGNVYGGGLGQKAVVDPATPGIEAFVGGDVFVTLDGAKLNCTYVGEGENRMPVTGQIFGCNNLNGTPKGRVKVWVKRTVDSDKSSSAALAKTRDQRTIYDVAAVYGGGNQADYIPTDATLDPAVEGNPTKIAAARAEVLIEGCDLTSIEYVYGGGNAAAVPATDVTIKGSYIIDYVFGGGNGKSTASFTNPGANVGSYNNGATNYGTGKAVTKLVGGKIHVVYGGSNTLGNVRGGTSVSMPQASGTTGSGEASCSEIDIREIYGAGQNADQDGGVQLILGCVTGTDNIVYGGAKNANVKGGVDLVITSGNFKQIFGGNDTSGTIQGPIKLTIEETACDPIEIKELYLGGKDAAYSVYGYKNTGTEEAPVLVARTKAEYETLIEGKTQEQIAALGLPYADPVLNVVSCTSIGRVFGGGLGSTAVMHGSPTVNINMIPGVHATLEHALGVIGGSYSFTEENTTETRVGGIYGGGSAADVYGNPTINIGTAETVTMESVEDNPDTENVDERVKTVEGAHIISNVYGGGLSAHVTGNTNVIIGTKNYTTEGYEGVSITGNVFGGGEGSTTMVTGNVAVTIGEKIAGEGNNPATYNGHATITGDIYGGSALGSVNAYDDNSTLTHTEGAVTGVTLNSGTITGSIYGGGLGQRNGVNQATSDIISDVYGPVTVTVNNGTVSGAVYGCNNLNGSPKNTVAVNIVGTATPQSPATYTIPAVYGGGNQAPYTGTGGLSVSMSGGYVNDVFGGGLGSTATVNGSTSVTISGGTITNDVYGGGSLADVTGAVTMALNGGTVARDVYGGGALAQTNTAYASGSAPANTYITTVTLAGATITRNLYGGGLGRLANGNNPQAEGYLPAIAADANGPVKVVVTSGSATNVFGCNNINGAPKSTVEVEIGTKTGESAPYTYDGTGTISGSVYGGGNMAAYTGTPAVKIYGGTVKTNVYGGGLGATAVTGGTSVTMEGGKVDNDVYGGGSQANVTGSVAVTIAGGTVTHDVYGGGALANTNTDNWNGDGSIQYVALTVKADPTADELAAGVLKTDVTPVAGYFTKSAGNYTRITNPDAKANGSTAYYKKAVTGTWADGKTSASNTTTVSLTGGLIGNAYGGGLGNSTTMANVYGDVTVTVNNGVTDPAKGIVFNQQIEHPVIGGTDYPTPVMGRVFGCNNYNGTPTGEVTVHVYSTRQIRKGTEGEILPGHGSNDRKFSYEIQSVYGGGNQADYLPAAGKKSHVIIEGCDETSIEKVYGGCNSAVIPETDVLIKGCYDIGYGFGGGNGGRPIKKEDGNWYENEGAIVIGTARIECQGGKIGQVFGGGDSKGSCGNTNPVIPEQGTGTCPLWITRLYGAGNEGDVSHVNIILAACSGNAIEYVHGGSYNAHVHGDVNLTITSGILKNVYGGNDSEGGIEGDITVNIEETDGCNPIIIQNLVGGGNEAAYPGTLKPGGVETPINRHGKITVNVKSATRIDNIYGGSFNAEADADTEININMMKGNKANTEVDIPKEFSYIPNITKLSDNEDGKTIHCRIDDAIGTIGNVFGGGKQGIVKGNTQVNINSSAKVYIMKRNADGKVLDTSGNPITTTSGQNIPAGITIDCTDEHDVEGAHITGDIFGGGENANVMGSERVDQKGNAEVYICANKTGEGTYEPVAEGAEKVSIGESVYGGGSEADVLGNTNVTMAGGYVYDGVYGGGLKGSVGTYTRTTDVTTESNNFDHSTHADVCLGKPTACTAGGTCTVVVSGGQVGPVEVATKGMKNKGGDGPVDVGFVFGAGRGDVENPNDVKDADFHTFVNKTDVTISGGLIMASVYGGGENGRVLNDTHVKIQGGQIGCGEAPAGVPKIYSEQEWASASVNTASTFKECLSWDYKSPFLPHDPYAQTGDTEDAKEGTDGHTYYGSVFGGGSGYYPYLVKNLQGTVTGHEWLRSAGAVYGNTVIDITGGHILTCVYGGNETTDVGTYSNNAKGQPLVHESGGKCTINMVGGTLGVPRTDEDAQDHPVTCYLFGAGKGDQRTRFNTWTNVQETVVNVSGTARIFGSVFGGGEDGHILGDAQVNIGGEVKIDLNGDGDTDDSGETFTADSKKLKIGTTGTSYVDGNVFGGGRGFSGVSLTAGSTGGNAEVNIAGGTMLGSIYGGGRLASVGIDFTSADDPSYGQLVDDKEGNPTTHGHITVNISGGTIGNDVEGAQYGGNVFGAGMGRNTKLNGDLNELWPKVATSKTTTVSISGGTIKKNVYGGAEFGIVRNQAKVTISETADIKGSVFGGGKGSDDYQTKTPIKVGGYSEQEYQYYSFTPMLWNGAVSGNTIVNIEGGTIGQNVYGGGELASVGLIDFVSDKDGNFTNMPKHESLTNGFGLSWPYKFTYHAAAPNDDAVGGKTIGGKATVTITGGHIGSDIWNDGTGYVFGGGKGMVDFGITSISEQRYTEAFCANVKETEVNVNFATPSGKNSSNIGAETNCIMGAVYGGGEDGHVYNDAKVNITSGLIGLSVYGAGKGISTYKGYLKDGSTDNQDDYKSTTDDLYSWTAGKVYGNTTVTMTNGHVLNNVYGGGYLGSVGKGNYSGGADDYYPAGYGETLTGNLWDNVSDNSKAFLSSGKATVIIEGGTVGTLNGTYGNVGGSSDVTPSGMVFGGSRGQAAEDVMLDPRYEYAPNFYLGYVNDTEVTIGNADGGPRIFSQVFGGGRDGHVRNSTHVIVNDGTIGQTYDETTGVAGSTADYQRYHRGNVYGSGSGLGQWESGKHGMSSGSVTNKTTVDINGGIIYNNVYGGGALSSVGPPRLNLEKDYAAATISQCVVNINGGTIGQTTPYETHKYGGCVYGASRGNDFAEGESEENFATVLWTKVNVNGGNIAGNVYGGAKGGLVWKDTEVHLKGGTIAHNAYGGGQGTSTIAANVGGNTTVKLNEGKGASDSGCIVEKVFGCNDLKGTPKGHALVHVYATQHKGTNKIVPDVGKYAKFNKLSEYTTSNYEDALGSLAAAAGLTPDQINAYKTAIDRAVGDDAQKAAIDNYIEGIAEKKYDVLAVYGGGDLAPYVPTDPTPATPLNDTEEYAEVIIEGCDLTSIKQVYGGSNAASVPATKLTINSAYEIHESFGGGNGKDNYELDTEWYENPGANIGYSATYHHNTSSGGSQGSPYAAVQNNGSDGYADATTKEARIANYSYGAGRARIEVYGGRIHRSYGGSNERGNIRYEASSAYEESGSCEMRIDETYGGGKNAETDADIRTDMECVDYTAELYGGSTNGDVNSNIVLNITNGTFGKVFGGNKVKGRIFGSITVNVKETGCKPIIIDNLYIGGDQAHYSIYGYSGDGNETARSKAEYDALTPAQKDAIIVQKDPSLNIISATRINNVYGGGYLARVVGSPHINVNMEEGTLAAKFMKDHAEYLTTDQTDTRITGTVKWRCRQGAEVEFEDHTKGHDGILPIGTIGNIYGGGDQALVDGSTTIEIGTGKHHNEEGVEEVLDPARSAAYITGRVYGGGNLGDVSGNATIEMGNGYVYDRIYGGGKEGNIGDITTRNAGKPTAFAENTGKTTVTISGGHVGPFEYSHMTGEEARAKVTIKPMSMQDTGADGVEGPDDYGHVFGGGRGELANPSTDPTIHNKTYVNETEVTIKNGYVAGHEGEAEYITRPLIAGGVYGGSENGRVLTDTHVNIQGGQIGIGKDLTTAYAESAFIDPTTTTVTDENKLTECAAWPYGIDTNSDGKKDTWLPYDEHAGNGHYQTATYGPASTTGSDGHTFYGNVFGGGSGYFAYETTTEGVYEWLPSAGLVEGNTYVNISGGHILTNVYGGNEMTNVTGTTNVTMTGGTLGVPRTLAQIAAHPVTCYLFGAGKGDQRVHFSKSTNVGHAVVNVSGGIIYGSVFGGGEDGHVLGDVTMNIQDVVDNTDPENPVVTSSPKIGTWGTSYVDGNVFGGGRGFSGDAYTAGNVAGSVTLNITGGTMLGSIYGGGRLGSVGYGLFDAGASGYGEMMADNATETGYVPVGGLTKGRGHVTVNISGDNTVIGNKYEYQYISPETTGDELATAKTYLPSTQFESNNRLKHPRGGNVFAGGMGRYTKLDGTSPISTYDGSGNLTSPIEWKKLGNVKSTKLTISGNPWIMGNVYGGGEFGAVQGYHTTEGKNYSTEILFTGGTIGTEITTADPQKETIETTASRSIVQYTFGSIYGGGMGQETPDATGNHGGDVKDSTYISMSSAASLVRASVYGGGEMAVVEGNTRVNISNGEIGRDEVKPADDADAGYVLFGGATMGNVYGGGKGLLGHTTAGQVKGNTNVNISGGNVYHMVYGGGALGSVGTFQLSTGTDPVYIPFAGVPYNWTEGTGTATVTITGGTIGISGRDNGLVFGSSRGGLAKPYDIPDDGTTDKLDPYDRVAWVNKSIVTIGTSGQGNDAPQPQIKCSVYGGGENGHNNESATVNVYSGTIGVTDTNDPYYNFGTNETVRAEAQLHRGNVYGAGSGSDTYTGDDGAEYWNPKSGMVGSNTFVNIYGGHIGRSVYGGGAMASVGTITNAADTVGVAKHASEATSFALSWPYKFEFATNTGKATVNVTGGHIGTYQLDGGDVYGSSRGEAGDRYKMAHLALTNETEVNINYTTPYELGDNDTEETIQNDFTKQCITGSVHGSGENGYVYGNTKVTLNEGLIGHSLYGAGKGNGTYTKPLNKIGGGGTYNAKIYSLIAGKVMGNTVVTMNGGHVMRNVYGGGNMGSVGKGNYAGGADDYYPAGYGETLNGSAEAADQTLWDSGNANSIAFLNSGKATVKVLGGIVGYINNEHPEESTKGLLPYGNVFGGSAGEAAPNIAEDPRYEYSPAFFSGYVNETDVTIGTSGQATDENAGTAGYAPRILGSIYGGGQDGHVRRDTKVTVYSGEIGVPYTSENQGVLGSNLDDPQWMHRGNIYGGGSGITKYKYDFDHDGTTSQDANDNGIIEDNEIDTGTYDGKSVKDEDYSESSGSVTRFTDVNILGGIIHRNVYGGGSNGSVGAPKIDQGYEPYKPGQADIDGKPANGPGRQSMNTVTIGGGSTVVTIGTPFNSTRGWTYNKTYGGEVYGACRGMSSLDPEKFANSVWTLVNIKDKSTIMGNVYGGGDSGIVKKDSEVKIGDPVTP